MGPCSDKNIFFSFDILSILYTSKHDVEVKKDVRFVYGHVYQQNCESNWWSVHFSNNTVECQNA